MVTKKGTIKKSALIAFSRPRVNGIIAIRLLEGDQLIDAQITEGDNDIILATSGGYANRFNETDARSMGRNSQGVRGIKLRDSDKVVAMVVVKRGGTLLSISENGYGKRSEVENYKVTKRGSKGVITLKTTERNGKLISLLEVVDNDDLMIVTKEGMIIRQAVDKISIIGRNTQGVKLIELNEKDKVYDITRIAAEPDEEGELFETLPETPVEVPDSEENTDTNNESTEEQEDTATKETVEEIPVKEKPVAAAPVKEEPAEEEPEIESSEEIQLDLELDE
jgi:DNA gyrase subunit A